MERTPAYRQLADSILPNFDVSQQEVDHIIADCATMVNYADKSTEVVEYFTFLFESPSSDDLRQMINALMEFMNSTRQWILKGHAPSEIQRGVKQVLWPLAQKPVMPQSAQGTGDVIDFRSFFRVKGRIVKYTRYKALHEGIVVNR